MNNRILLILIIAIANSAVFLSSCRTIDDCTENQVLGNMGAVVNTNLDEHSPTIYSLPDSIKNSPNADPNDYLYFTATRYDQGQQEVIYNVLLDDIAAGSELVSDPDFPLNNTDMFRNAGVPVFRYNPNTHKVDLFFAALPKFGRLSRDIYFSELDLDANEWSEPVQLSINSPSWESHPTISPDGNILLFASDRAGGFGDIDIWASYWNADSNTWSAPVNLGEEINTKGTDFFPMFTYGNDIIFSSNGRNKNRNDHDIYYAKYDSVAKKWTNPHPFGFPINTEFNEMGACIWNNRIFLSSDRRGGCGGKDIYSFQICGPVLIAGKVQCANPKQALEGELTLLSETGDIIESVMVGADGVFNIANIEANKNYKVKYTNNCYPLKKNEYTFHAPCSDSSSVKTLLSMIIPDKYTEINLTEVEVPYFVTGYYKPNTSENLNALRLGFSYNIYGNNPKSKYIENPKDKYNQSVEQVEKKLDSIVKHITDILVVLDNHCDNNSNKGHLTISIQGFADPRRITSGSEFLDASINDATFGMHVQKGSKMDNELLSRLRAYFTGKYFQSKLNNDPDFANMMSKITWKITGRGIDTTENVEDGLKRKVRIKLEYTN